MTMSIRSIRAIRAPRTFKGPIRKASDTWDWLTPEEVIRQALAAYYATCRQMERRWATNDADVRNIDRYGLAQAVCEYFTYRLEADGFKKGVSDDWHWSQAEKKLEELDLYPRNLNIEGGRQ